MRKKERRSSRRLFIEIEKTQTQFSLKLVIQTIFILLSKQTFHVHVTWFFILFFQAVDSVVEPSTDSVAGWVSMSTIVHHLLVGGVTEAITFERPLHSRVVCWSTHTRIRMKGLFAGWTKIPIESEDGQRWSLQKKSTSSAKERKKRRRRERLEMWPN